MLGLGLALAAPSTALAVPIDEIVTDAVPAGTTRIVLDLEGAADAASDLAVRWHDDATFTPVTLAPTPFGLAADLTQIGSSRLAVQVMTAAPEVSYAVTFVDEAGRVIGERRHDLDGDGGTDEGGGGGGGGGGASGGGDGSASTTPGGGLAGTGGDLPFAWLALGAVAVATGTGIVVARTRRAHSREGQA